MQFRPDDYTLTEIDPVNGITWTCDHTTPEQLRGLTLHSGVPCFIGHIDYSEPAVKFAVPEGMKNYPIIRLNGRPELARLVESYRPATDSAPDTSWVPKNSVRGKLIEQSKTDPHMPEGLKKAVNDLRRNWADDENADYLIHGPN